MGARVVIAEKDYLTAAGYEAILERLGHEVCGIVATGPAAIEAAARHQPDLMILDGALANGSSGLFAAAYISENTPVPVILISSAVSHETAVAAGVARLLHKPLSLAVLRTAIEDILRQREEDSRHRPS